MRQPASQPGSGSRNLNEQETSTLPIASWPEPYSGPGYQEPTLHSHQMGQGASTPRDAAGNPSSHSDSAARHDGSSTTTGGQAGTEAGERSTAARLRRSRRLQTHLDRLSRLGLPERWMPSGSNTSTRSRLSRLRPRSGAPNCSRSPSPRVSLRQELQERRRTMPSISRPIPIEEPTPTVDVSGLDMMDISPVTSAVQQPAVQQPAVQQQEQPTEEPMESLGVRRTRISRIRDSVSSWSDLVSRHRGGRTPSDSRRNSVLENVDLGAMDIDNPTAPRLPPHPHVAETSSSDSAGARPDRPSLFGPNVLEGLENTTRVRPGEDQAAMLSRLLSVAAAATAASLVGSADQAITEAQDVAGDNGGDGSFESFLRALQNGRLEAALRNGGNEMGGPAAPTISENGVLSLNYFRMFRFGSQGPTAEENEEAQSEGHQAGGRMVPVIIVGIRSVTPRDNPENEENNRHTLPFFDAMANLPLPVPTAAHRRTRLGRDHRRTASAGGNPSSNPQTALQDSLFPPPDTRRTEPSLDRLAARQRETNRRSTGDIGNTQPRPEEGTSNTSTTRDNIRRHLDRMGNSEELLRPRTSSSRPGAPRPTAPSAAEGTRSWIIYVLGGSYPENHPILTTPSLFTDEPTFEDMTLLSSLLGPAKPPVAAQSDIESAGGVFIFGAEDCPIQFEVWNGDRCLVCLSDYEKGQEGRQLTKCKHMFHRECIDEWLTTGRNSCPLCRGEGVEEKSKPESSDAAEAPAALPTVAPAS